MFNSSAVTFVSGVGLAVDTTRGHLYNTNAYASQLKSWGMTEWEEKNPI